MTNHSQSLSSCLPALEDRMSLNLLHTLHAREPVGPLPHELLDLRLQLGLHQVEVVDGADAQDAGAGPAGADAVHEGAADLAEVVGHGAAGLDGLLLAVGVEVLLAPQVLQVRVGDGEVGGEHGGRDLVAVAAVADEGVEQAWAFGWLAIGGQRRKKVMIELQMKGRKRKH